jgi:hypothetical protein
MWNAGIRDLEIALFEWVCQEGTASISLYKQKSVIFVTFELKIIVGA